MLGETPIYCRLDFGVQLKYLSAFGAVWVGLLLPAHCKEATRPGIYIYIGARDEAVATLLKAGVRRSQLGTEALSLSPFCTELGTAAGAVNALAVGCTTHERAACRCCHNRFQITVIPAAWQGVRKCVGVSCWAASTCMLLYYCAASITAV
jgi:hypothetical protein